MERTTIQSPTDLLTVAISAAREAASGYTVAAQEMRAYGNDASASVFDEMAAIEAEREQLVRDWAEGEGIEPDAAIGAIHWADPGAVLEYDEAASNPIRSTAYRVLAFVVHNAERAFQFYTHVAASGTDETVCDYAEILAQEELEHATRMRAKRRHAWHTERNTHTGDPDVDPAFVVSLGDFQATSASLERCVYNNLIALQKYYPQFQPLIDQSEQLLGKLDAGLQSSAVSGEAAVSNIELIEAYSSTIERLGDDKNALLRRLYSDSDRCFMFYDAVVSRSQDEVVMLQAQSFNSFALQRLDMLRESMRPEVRN
jgi:rubrerythrin